MKIKSFTQTFPAPRQKGLELSSDPQRHSEWMAGSAKSSKQWGEKRIQRSQINVGLAARQRRLHWQGEVDEMQPLLHYKMLIDGKGKQGFIKGSGTLDFAEQNGQTLLNLHWRHSSRRSVSQAWDNG